jgi:hypothetical protein
VPDAVFIETTIPSYYVARESRNLVQLARQQLTREWWDFHRGAFDLYTSQLVLDEAADGDVTMAHERLMLLRDLPLLDIDGQVSDLAQELLAKTILPPIASRDALHIACSAVHRMHFLLTWNCKHTGRIHWR